MNKIESKKSFGKQAFLDLFTIDQQPSFEESSPNLITWSQQGDIEKHSSKLCRQVQGDDIQEKKRLNVNGKQGLEIQAKSEEMREKRKESQTRRHNQESYLLKEILRKQQITLQYQQMEEMQKKMLLDQTITDELRQLRQQLKDCDEMKKRLQQIQRMYTGKHQEVQKYGRSCKPLSITQLEKKESLIKLRITYLANKKAQNEDQKLDIEASLQNFCSESSYNQHLHPVESKSKVSASLITKNLDIVLHIAMLLLYLILLALSRTLS